ncbi:MAG: phenylalanine--tRNA ligase subunit alpha [Methylacidiphilales bacterium]|nr:phenylalanine--tRNA ligase subunit alpha [Candidatus Methylacidiphilales bacterium]MDW8348884.1 phenylalanine--tRNA ligase subunit alpha [Verrucomicrobiae bacterium]
MNSQLEALTQEILTAIEQAKDAKALDFIRTKYFSRQGAFSLLRQTITQLPPEERRAFGQAVNAAYEKLQSALSSRAESFAPLESLFPPDPTLPPRTYPQGSLHPVLTLLSRSVEIFRSLGFALADGPEVEYEYFNFDALNTPPDHPARNEQDTFYIDPPEKAHPKWGRRLLRTQTSPIQIRVMQSQKPPIRIIAPGRCYRRDEIDATHSLSFHQIEGLYVDQNVTLAQLKGTLEYFFRSLLGNDLEFRFRPHFFPFTEPSFEVDCARSDTVYKGKKWLEICGCGMVHPKVLEESGIDPEKYTGFAFGFGLERIAMQIHGVTDLRMFTENDIRLLSALTPPI